MEEQLQIDAAPQEGLKTNCINIDSMIDDLVSMALRMTGNLGDQSLNEFHTDEGIGYAYSVTLHSV